MFRLAAFLVLVCASLLAQDSKRAGIIRGIVLDATDQPVEDATVKANFTGGFSGIVPSSRTDKSGHFVIQHLVSGEWYVTASKEQEGYPDESNAFYSGFGLTPVTVDLEKIIGSSLLLYISDRKLAASLARLLMLKLASPLNRALDFSGKTCRPFPGVGTDS